MERISLVDLEKNSFKNIWLLAWPVMISQVLFATLNIVDMFWIGKLGASQVASVAIAGSIMGVTFAITQIFYAGNLAMVARFAGRGGKNEIEPVVIHSFVLAFLAAIMLSVSGFILAPSIFRLFGATKTVTTVGISYIRIIFLVLPFLFGAHVVFATLTALGDTKTPTKITAVACFCNILLDPLLIFGIWKFPKLGVNGAAIATSLSFSLALILGIFILFKRGYLHTPFPKICWKTSISILKIGIPACLQGITRPLTGMIMFRIVAFYGTSAIAAFGIGMRTLGLMFIYLTGLMTSAQTLVGQSLGAKKLKKAEEVVRRVLLIGFVIQIPVTILYILFAPQIISIFNTDPDVIRIGTEYLRIISLSLTLISFTIAFGGAQYGAGDTKPPMIASVISNWLLKIPIAYIIANHLHLASRGVWIAIALSVLVESIIVAIFYYRGGWKRKKL